MPVVDPAVRTAVRTLGAQLLLLAALPANVTLTGAALVASAVSPAPEVMPARRRTVLVSGGKMTKALHL